MASSNPSSSLTSAPPPDPNGSNGSNSEDKDTRPVLFFDIDNCLYPRSLQIQDLMAGLIDSYFVRHLSLSAEDATALHSRYYRDYGLAISGLVKHHKVDPLAYNEEVDNALPLEDIIKPDKDLQELLEGVDKSKCKLWLFTNAHITHARRVVSLLGVERFFEGLTYCDYTQQPLVAKPHDDMFEKAEMEAGVYYTHPAPPPPSPPPLQGKDKEAKNDTTLERNKRKCYFVDDSSLNCRAAKARGWVSVHKIEMDDPEPEGPTAGTFRIRQLSELRELFPDFWTPMHGDGGGTKI